MIALGKVLRPHGTQGEFSVLLSTSGIERLTEIGRFYLGPADGKGDLRLFRLGAVRMVGRKAVVKLIGVDSVDAAEELQRKFLLIPDAEEALLSENEYYAHDITGCRVETADGENLGVVVEVLGMPAQDVYVVKGVQKTWWLPAAKTIIREINVKTKCIRVDMVDGLLETGPPH